MTFDFFTQKFGFIYYQISSKYFITALVAFILFYIIFKQRFALRKIQSSFPKLNDYKRDILYSIVTVVFFTLISILTFFILKPYNLIYYNYNDYPIWYFGLTFVMMFFLHDFYFYWAHRLMHHPQIFKTVHLIHHKSTNPSPWTAYAFHPIEAFIEAFIVTIIAFSFPVHRDAVLIFMIFQIVYNVYGHLGYELYPKGFNKTWIGKWINTSIAHNLHHKKFEGNFGLYTLIWDRVFGTLRNEYDQVYESSTSQPWNNPNTQTKVPDLK